MRHSSCSDRVCWSLAGRYVIRAGVLKETAPLERRVAATPETTARLIELGFEVVVQRGAGVAAGYDDAAYAATGATLIDGADIVLSTSDLLLKVRPPSPDEAGSIKERATLISLLQPERHPALPDLLAARHVSSIALERIPRITRAQKMDVLSSMANLAGYRAVIEAAAHYPGFFSPQITAAGATPPAHVLVIGAGVAGLAAIAAARALGAEVRAFDTRAAAREQVQSLGASFLEVELKESGEGSGGYAKTMSPEFIAAEMELFRAQAAQVNIVITTALVPGAKAPILLPEDVLSSFRPGTVIVDMAAEQGGNCALTRPDEIVEWNGIRILGFTDLTSRMAQTASRFFATNVLNLVVEMGGGAGFRVDLESDVVRPALVTHDAVVLPRPKPPEPSPAPSPAKKTLPPPVDAKPKQQQLMNPTRAGWGTTFGGLMIIALLFFLGRFAPEEFLKHFTVFILACFVGWQVIWSVSPALHTPLMSVTNAISGIIIIGGIAQIGPAPNLTSVLGALAVLVAAINISGGFLVTQRMLKMFRREGESAR